MNAESDSQRYFVFYPHVQLVRGSIGAAVYDLFNMKLFWIRDPIVAIALTRLSLNDTVADAAMTANMEKRALNTYLEVLTQLEIGMFAEQKTAVETYRPMVLISQAEDKQIYRPGGVVTIEITGKCVYNCPWCTSRTILTPAACSCGVWSDQGESLSISHLISAVKQLNYTGVDKLVIAGGEPMLEPERLWRLISTATQLGMQCEIHTTGTLIDDEMIRQLHKRPVRFVLLVAAMEAEEFDTYAGVPGSWSRFQKGITALRSSGISFSAKIPVSFNSPEEKSAITSWIKQLGAANAAYFLYVPELDCIQTDLRAALGPTSAMDMAVSLFQFARNGQCHSCFDHSYFIAADGRITPCIGQRKAIANLFISDMADILREGELTSQRSTSRVEITECKSCEFRLGCWACIVRTEQIKGTPSTRHWNCRYSPETATWG